MSELIKGVQRNLNALGWTVVVDGVMSPGGETKRSVRDFQRGWNLGAALLVDGDPGPRTREALALSVGRKNQGLPTASTHFSFVEFKCKCGGAYRNCADIRVHRDLLRGLEDLRAHYYPNGMKIVSGYRCPGRNAAVGGASSSQHLYGAAADITAVTHYTNVTRLRRFSGIGKQSSTNKCRHVDVRHVSGNNTTGGTPDRPTIWNY